MTLRSRLLVTAILLAPGMAIAAPPADGMPASEILRLVEQRPDFRHLREMEWDDDGYWEVEYATRDGGRVEIRLDPRSGQILRR